jgi:hypothetical protein
MKDLQMLCPETEETNEEANPSPLANINDFNAARVRFIAQAAWGNAPVRKSSAVWGKSVNNWQNDSVARVPVSSFYSGAR